MSVFKYLVIVTLFVLVLNKKFDPRKVLYAVDCGSTQHTKSSQGFTYTPDTGYSPNTKVADYSTNAEAAAAMIRYTGDPGIYLTERHADDTFYYDIPVRTPGTYVLISKFSENWMKAPRERIFNINFGNCVGQQGVDVFAEVGKFAAYDSYIEFVLRNNNIYVNGQLCSGALVGNNKLRVSYTKIGIDNPMVDAIILYDGPLRETDFEDIPAMRKDWERKVKDEAKRREEERIRKEEARLKRKEKAKVRNDDFEDFGDDFEEGDFQFKVTKSIGDYIQDYLGLGIVLIIGAVLISILSGKGESIPVALDFDQNEGEPQDKGKKEKKDKTTSSKKKLT